MMAELPFWQRKSLAQMSIDEWESLCDGCGRCCLQKLQSEDDNFVMYTRVACRLLDPQSCRCSDYRNRVKKVAQCLTLSVENIDACNWLPASCAYMRLHRGEGLASWHPLVSGKASTVHRAGISMRGKTVSESYIHPSEIGSMIIEFDQH